MMRRCGNDTRNSIDYEPNIQSDASSSTHNSGCVAERRSYAGGCWRSVSRSSFRLNEFVPFAYGRLVTFVTDRSCQYEVPTTIRLPRCRLLDWSFLSGGAGSPRPHQGHPKADLST